MKLILDTTTKSLEIKLAGAPATTQLPWVVNYVDRLSSTQAVSALGNNNGATNSGTAVTMLAAPASGHTRQVVGLSVPNVDTAAVVLTLQYNDNGTLRIIYSATHAVGDNLIVDD